MKVLSVSREGRRFLKSILSIYVKDMINDHDFERTQREILDVMQAERRLAWNAGYRAGKATNR